MADDLDFEVCKDYYLTLEAWDGGNPPLSSATVVTIELMDVNDNAPTFSQDIYSVLVSEDASVGQMVTRVTVYSSPATPFGLPPITMLCSSVPPIGVGGGPGQPGERANHLLNPER